jgi:hypothetical protein
MPESWSASEEGRRTINKRKAVLIADASVGMIKGVMSDGFRESIMEWGGMT